MNAQLKAHKLVSLINMMDKTITIVQWRNSTIDGKWKKREYSGIHREGREMSDHKDGDLTW